MTPVSGCVLYTSHHDPTFNDLGVIQYQRNNYFLFRSLVYVGKETSKLGGNKPVVTTHVSLGFFPVCLLKTRGYLPTVRYFHKANACVSSASPLQSNIVSRHRLIRHAHMTKLTRLAHSTTNKKRHSHPSHNLYLWNEKSIAHSIACHIRSKYHTSMTERLRV